MRSPRQTRQHGPADVFHAGHVRSRPTPGHSQAHPGVAPLHPVSHRNTSFQPLPRPLDLPPYHYSLAEKFPHIAEDITQQNRQIFHVVGDTGGVQDGEFQDNVAEHMIRQLASGERSKPQFCYHVGDVVYYTGAHDDYYAQFYEPYAHYEVPIFAIPGNHDGEVDDPSAQTSLDGWVDYFMQAHPDVDPISKDAPRVQLDLPNVYWTFVTPMATIVGVYTNVPEHGSIDSTQQQWLTNEFATAPEDRALVLALHHPIYSFDAYHSGVNFHNKWHWFGHAICHLAKKTINPCAGVPAEPTGGLRTSPSESPPGGLKRRPPARSSSRTASSSRVSSKLKLGERIGHIHRP